MPSRIYTRYKDIAAGNNGGIATIAVADESSTWQRSSRVGRKLVVKPLPCDMKKCINLRWSVAPNGPNIASPTTASIFMGLPGDSSSSFASLDNQAYARFNGKLRKGSASLGVTLASWKQSRDMIRQRLNHVGSTLDSAYARLKGDKGAVKRLRKERQPLANQVLETEFGWIPLFQDVHAALFTVVQQSNVAEWITSRARGTVDSESVTLSSGGNYRNTMRWTGKRWVTYNARVSIANPNLWLLNRLGLINPATVAWDIIPWSFVVNMFVNVNQMISSVTDEVGLSITDRNVTRGQRILLTNDVLPLKPQSSGSQFMYCGTGHSENELTTRSRQLNAAPSLSWQLKVPDLNWELAVIASSLLLQKADRLNKLIRVI